nr:acyl phosphate:glycerol-3-phosphate acyltransferase [Candidatus Cloacimonadota bacterium]
MNSANLWMPIAAYFIGSIPVGWIISKVFYKTDIRTKGSGNIGATNALRNFGTSVGIIVLLLDMLKGFLVVRIAGGIFGMASGMVTLCGLLAILGHVFPVWLKFRGGKGVATAAGVFLALAPLSLGIAFGLFVIVVVLTRYVSLGSILAALTFGVVVYISEFQKEVQNWSKLLLITVVVLVIIYNHRQNIERLLQGKENRLTFTKKGNK